MEKDKRLMESSSWERLTERETGLVLIDGPYSTNLESNFLLMGRTVFPPCYSTWDQTMVEVMKITVISFKRSQHALLHSVALTLQQASTDACLHWRLLNTHGQVGVSLFWAHCSCLLGPGLHKVLFELSKRLFPQSCVSFSSSMVGLMATSSKKAYAIPRSAAPGAQALRQATADPCLHRRHSNTVLAQSLWDLWFLVCTIFVWGLWASLECMEFDFKCNFAPSTIFLGLLLCPWMWGIYFW